MTYASFKDVTAMRYAMNGRTLRYSQALALVLDAWQRAGHNDAQGYWNGAHLQETEGYIARDVIEQEVPGLTLRHPNEELGS